MSAPERGAPGTWQGLAFWADGAMALRDTQQDLAVNDHYAAQSVLAERGGGLSYAKTSGTWYIWDGKCHRPDDSGEIDKIVIGWAVRYRDMLSAARNAVWFHAVSGLGPEASDAARNKAFEKEWEWWKKAETYNAGLFKSAGHTSLVNYLIKHCGKSEEELAEHHPGLVNTASGTLDLASRVLRGFRREDMITYALKDRWSPQAQCPRFWNMLYRMCGNDYEVACYLVKCLGYALLGDNREQKIIFINGPTGSGKSQILHIVSQVIGPLAHASQSELITVVKGGNRNARTENSIRGKRLVTITETSKFMNIDEAQLKRLTGEPWISVNQHYAKTEIRTPVTWTIFVATNDMPNLVNFDAAMRRRIIVIPGGPTIPDWEMDSQLAAGILSTEREGILSLLVHACAEYFRSGLTMPQAVLEETEKYAIEQNTVASFIADTIAIGGWSETGGIMQNDAWQVYQQWSKGSSHLTRTGFYRHMREHPAVTYNPGSRRFEGIAWNADWAARVHF